MTIYFLGWYGRRNSGDETFKLVHKAMFPSDNIKWITDSEIPPLKQSDVVVLGCGDVMRDFYIQRMPESTRFFVFGVGLDGKSDSDVAISLRDRIIAGWFRNRTDVDYLVSQGVNAFYTPDVVFQLKRDVNSNWKNRQIKEKKKMICFFSNNNSQHSLYSSDLNGFISSIVLKRNIASSLDAIADYYDFIFFPLSKDWNDYDISFGTDVFSMMKRRDTVEIIEEQLGFHDIISMIEESDIVLTMKFHGIIYSILAETSFVNIGLSDKTQKVCEENGLSAISIAPDTLNKDVFLKKLKKAEDEAILIKIKDIGQANYMEAMNVAAEFKDALNTWRKYI